MGLDLCLGKIFKQISNMHLFLRIITILENGTITVYPITEVSNGARSFHWKMLPHPFLCTISKEGVKKGSPSPFETPENRWWDKVPRKTSLSEPQKLYASNNTKLLCKQLLRRANSSILLGRKMEQCFGSARWEMGANKFYLLDWDETYLLVSGKLESWNSSYKCHKQQTSR